MAKSKLTPDTHERIVQAVRAGNYFKQSAEAAGITDRTFYYWIEQGEADAEQGRDTAHLRFLQAITRAQAEAEVHAVANIRKAMSEDWRAAAEYLRRRHPDRWSTQDRIEHGGKVEHGGSIEISSKVNNEIERLLGELAPTGED